MTVRLGILGATRGLNFAFAARKGALKNVVISAVCDCYQPLLEKVRAQMPEHGFQPVYYSDYSQMLRDSNVDAVIIANNATEHAPAAIAALNAGKHVFSECLPTQTLAQAVELAETMERSGKHYYYAESYCYFRANFEAALRCRRGEIGDVVHVECEFINDCTNRWHILTRGLRNHWRNFVPATFYCTHSIGPVLFAVRQRPVKVTGYEIKSQEYIAKHGARCGTAGVEMMELANGVYVKSLHGNLKRPWVTRMNLYGTKGTLEVVNASTLYRYTDTGEAYSGFNAEQITEWTGIPGIPAAVMADADLFELWCFVESLEGNPVAKEYSIDVYSALNMSLPGLLAYRSILAGGVPVAIPDMSSAADRELYRTDRKCTDPAADPEDRLPSCSKGEIEQPDSVYELESRKMDEYMKNSFKLGMN